MWDSTMDIHLLILQRFNLTGSIVSENLFWMAECTLDIKRKTYFYNL